MKTILRRLVLFAILGAITLPARAESATLQGILITASNEAGQTDRRLASYEPTLRRILRFESYRFLGDDTASLEVPASGRLSLGNGHELVLTSEPGDGKTIHIKVRWTAGGRVLMNTGLNLRPGVPAVLGGPATGHKDEVYAVILTGR